MFINFLYVLVYALKNYVLVLNFFFFPFYFSFVIDNWYFSLLILKCAMHVSQDMKNLGIQ
jgi:hypothetical protein